MRNLTFSIFLASIFYSTLGFSQTTAKELVFNIEVTNSAAPPSITLRWNKQTGISAYNILKKNRTQKNFTAIASNVQLNDTVFTDYNVVVGNAYEYCVQGSINVNVSGYVYAGIELPEVHQAGEVLLLIDSTYQIPAMFEIEEYKLDLIKEGWKVITAFVGRTQSVSSVKQIIIDKYNANPLNLKGVILLGHVPIPYSGNIAPDAHTDHIGAWPCDMYYGNLSTSSSPNIWIDLSLTSTIATDARNHNTIGDGKFDASNKPTSSAVMIFVGRIDVYNMPAINANDVVLFKQYLAKNHSYRAGVTKFKPQGIVDDNFGFFGGEAFAQNGWRNFSALLGSNNVAAGDYQIGTKADSYMWSYGCGSGSYTSCGGIGSTSNFSSNQMQSVFTMLYGSYYGDWDNQNNFLRAPIASPSSTLVSIWGGRPNWFLHTMAMGEPIGYSYINSVDNASTYFPKGYYSNKIHQSMQGDPTLKMYMFEAPSNVRTTSIDNDTKVRVQWAASADSSIIGYYVYRAPAVNEDFVLLNSTYETSTLFIDSSQGFDIEAVYMVKAVKLETSTTGSFYNLSPGSMSLENPVAVVLPVSITSFAGRVNNDQTNSLYWDVKNEQNLLGYSIERSIQGQDYEKIGFVETSPGNASEKSYSFVDANPELVSNYRLKSIDIDGKFEYSNIINLTRVESNLEIVLYPSPFSNYLNIIYATANTTTLSIIIRDLTGKVVSSQKASIGVGQNTIQVSDLDKLKQGLYFVMISDNEHDRNDIIKVLKE